MRVVAERLVRRLATAAERGARQQLERPIVAGHFDAAADEERAVADRGHVDRLGRRLLGAAVEPPILERAARAAFDHLRELVGIRLVRQDPRPPAQLKDLGRAAEALAYVRA